MSGTPNPTPQPTRASTITLREITEENWRPVANLRILPSQQGNLASVQMSMIEGHYSEDAWQRAVYADETLVGFLMMALWPPTEGYYIWRLLIDEKFQRMGFGAAVVRLAIEHVKRTFPEAKRLGVMSTPEEGKEGVEAECSPFGFYRRLGFVKTEEPDEDGDVMMMIDL